MCTTGWMRATRCSVFGVALGRRNVQFLLYKTFLMVKSEQLKMCIDILTSMLACASFFVCFHAGRVA